LSLSLAWAAAPSVLFFEKNESICWMMVFIGGVRG
jgi:hypothetical protein